MLMLEYVMGMDRYIWITLWVAGWMDEWIGIGDMGLGLSVSTVVGY